MPLRPVLQLSATCLLTSLLVVAAGTRLSGQSPADLPPAGAGFLVLVPMREMADIEAAVAAADADLARAQRAEHLASNLRIDARADIERMKQALVAVKRRRTAAKDAASPEYPTLNAETKALEREQDLLEERERLGSVEIDLARRFGELAGLGKRALELERELLLKRREFQGGEGPEASSRQRVMLDLEEQTLRAQAVHADKKIDVATLEKQVIDRLLKILSAQRRVVVS